MIYYLLITISTVMFGVQFLFNDIYRKHEGSTLFKSVVFSLGTAAVIAVLMLVIGGFSIEFTPFAFVLALLSAVNAVLFAYCSVVSLSKINLSLYSLFVMLGGMILPVIAGVLFGEAFGLRKAVCIVIIIIALSVGVDFNADKRTLVICFVMFMLNGLAGVIAKWHQFYADAAVSGESFMFWKSIMTVVISVFLLIFIDKDSILFRKKGAAFSGIAGFALMSGFGNFFLLVALNHVDASVQYPMVSGGTIVVSTVIAFVSGSKLNYKNIISTVLAIGATLLLV